MSYTNHQNKYRTIASFTTNAREPAKARWDLTPYKTAGIGTAGGTWRLIEVGYNLLYQNGKISADGTLVSNSYEETQNGNRTSNSTTSALPDHFDSHYSYDGYMELQVAEPEDGCQKCP